MILAHEDDRLVKGKIYTLVIQHSYGKSRVSWGKSSYINHLFLWEFSKPMLSYQMVAEILCKLLQSFLAFLHLNISDAVKTIWHLLLGGHIETLEQLQLYNCWWFRPILMILVNHGVSSHIYIHIWSVGGNKNEQYRAIQKDSTRTQDDTCTSELLSHVCSTVLLPLTSKLMSAFP